MILTTVQRKVTPLWVRDHVHWDAQKTDTAPSKGYINNRNLPIYNAITCNTCNNPGGRRQVNLTPCDYNNLSQGVGGKST